MNAEVAKALEESIEHWKRMKRAPLVCRERFESPRADCCPLCLLMQAADGSCSERCPVAARATIGGCNGTPYATALSAWWPLFRHCGSPIPRDLRVWRKAAQVEIEFLNSLREETT